MSKFRVDKFTYEAGDLVFLSICHGCKHNHPKPKVPATCDAFLAGIPEEFLRGEAQHLEPTPGQGNDLVFDPKPGFEGLIRGFP
jgi:hypothetical protein